LNGLELLAWELIPRRVGGATRQRGRITHVGRNFKPVDVVVGHTGRNVKRVDVVGRCGKGNDLSKKWYSFKS